ncbi:BTAD domain-containing putative transcriptional regulator [Lentzea sp. NPDC006480]|uniref:AfsR/SARP family transcriptional regulator n=1 Tax=Lentzea sp. NPDC006480 TaxID=3157176 RepID=UPI0033BE044A
MGDVVRAEYRVLGPLEVILDGEPVAVPAGRSRVLLAVLLLRANRFVSAEELVELVWDGTPPRLDRAKSTLQMVVRRLRVALGDADCVRSAPGGYFAEIEPDQLDLLRFRALAGSGDFAAAAALWRGPVLADVASDAVHRDDVRRLAEERLVVLERRIEADLDRGLAGELLPELRALTAKHPLREPFWRQLMLALYRSGQQAAALLAYQELRTTLADELGIDPDESLRDLHERILRAEVPPGGRLVPRQLPSGVRNFVGRDEELRLLGELDGVTVVHGVGGVGKTAITLRWGREVRDRFPDGDLYVNLRGFDPEVAPLEPAAAAEVLLVGMGVEEIPADPDARFGLLRTTMAGRRLLLVLDNAASSRQVVPLLPGAAGVRLVVTSRNQLRALVSQHDATAIGLRQLDFAAARTLLAAVIGAARLDAEPEGAHAIVERCAGLPLALRVVAERVARFPDTSLREFVAELDAARLDVLSDFDDVDVRSVFSWSYRALDDESARMFRLLSVHPGQDFDVAAAAALAGVPIAQARRLLERLVADHLVQSRSPGRYDLHDLLRAYSNELCGDDETAALQLTEWYTHTLVNASDQLQGTKQLVDAGEITSRVVPQRFTSAFDAMSWVRNEWDNLKAVTRAAIARGWTRLALLIPAHLIRYLNIDTGRRPEALELFERVRDFGTEQEQAILQIKLASLYGHCGRAEEALRAHENAVRFARKFGDRRAEAMATLNMVGAYERLGRLEDALATSVDGFALLAELDDPFLYCAARANASLILSRLGRYAEAVEQSTAAVAIAVNFGDEFVHGRIHTMHGEALAGVGRLDEAVSALEFAVEVMVKFGDRENEGEALRHLGHVLLRLDRRDDAVVAWRRAVELWRALDDPRLVELVERLRELEAGR